MKYIRGLDGVMHLKGIIVSSRSNVVRVSTYLTREATETLQAVAERRGVSMTEIVRRALALEAVCNDRPNGAAPKGRRKR
jgi:Ribbon-helix-helix protein, copG family